MEKWRIYLGGWGIVLLLASFAIVEKLNFYNLKDASLVISGYVIGFYTTLAGYLFWEVLIAGRWARILGPTKGFARVIAALPLSGIFIYGLVGFLVGIFGSTPWFYNSSFALAGLAASQGFIPLINFIDGEKP